MFNLLREGSTFDNFLLLQEKRIDDGVSGGFAANDRQRILRTARLNRRVRRQSLAECHSRYEQAVESGLALDSNGDVMSFLEWLIANADTILALVAKIIALFA